MPVWEGKRLFTRSVAIWKMGIFSEPGDWTECAFPEYVFFKHGLNKDDSR